MPHSAKIVGYLLQGCTDTEFIALEVILTGVQGGEQRNGAAAGERVVSSTCKEKRSRIID